MAEKEKWVKWKHRNKIRDRYFDYLCNNFACFSAFIDFNTYGLKRKT